MKDKFPAFALGALLIGLFASLLMNIALFRGTIMLPENSCHDLIDSLHVMQEVQQPKKGIK